MMGRSSLIVIYLNLLYGLEAASVQSGFKLGKRGKVCWVLRLENRMDGAQWISDVVSDNC